MLRLLIRLNVHIDLSSVLNGSQLASSCTSLMITLSEKPNESVDSAASMDVDGEEVADDAVANDTVSVIVDQHSAAKIASEVG